MKPVCFVLCLWGICFIALRTNAKTLDKSEKYNRLILDVSLEANRKEIKETKTSVVAGDMGIAGVAVIMELGDVFQWEEPAAEEPEEMKEETANQNKEKYSFTEAEFDYFCRCVEAESGGESAECRRAVAEVLLNRLDSERYPNTIHGVIDAKNQFEVVNNGSIWKVCVSEETKEICRQAITQERQHPTTMFYFRDSRYHNDNEMNRYKNIDNMYFSLYAEVK